MEKKKRTKVWVFRVVLLLFSIGITLILCEVALRILKPELGELVNAEQQTHSFRIFANPISSRKMRTNPDTKEEHLAMFNSFGCRQHRDFSKTKPEGTIRVALCGDSYTVNDRLPVPYSLSEPLEHLFNESGMKTEVLNFGTGGYGTDQIYLQYKDATEEMGLDVVLYIACWNDFVDVVANKLFEIDENGELRYLPVPKPSLAKRIARKFYLTYFVLSALKGQEMQEHGDVEKEYGIDHEKELAGAMERRDAIRIALYRELTSSPNGVLAEKLTRALLADWKRIAESRGQDFYLVLLPRNHRVYTIHRQIAADLGITVLDLHETAVADEAELEELFFKTDLHWNAEGNKYGAVHLFKFLTEQQGWENPGDEFIKRTLSDYYHSFDPDQVSDDWLLENYPGPDDETRKKIRDRIVPFERRFDGREGFITS